MLTSKKVFISGNKDSSDNAKFFRVIAPRTLWSCMVYLTKLLGLKAIKGKAFPARAMKANRGSRRIAPFILNPGCERQ